MMSNFILMIQFFTRIPIPISVDVKEDSFVKGIAYYSLVGSIIGGFNLLVYYLLSLVFSSTVSIIAVIISNTLLTGAFHLDGLADTCDGIYSARPKDRMLEIMKDSRVGTNGVIAIVFDFMLRYAFLSSISSEYIMLAILLAPIASKMHVGFLAYITKYARKQGLAGLFMDKITLLPTLINIVIGFVFFAVFLGGIGIILLLSYTVVTLLYKVYIYKKIDGMTGDTLGAANEVIEIICMMSFIFL